MSEFVTSLNDRTADDEAAKKKPKPLSGYFELFEFKVLVDEQTDMVADNTPIDDEELRLTGPSLDV
jgi:hypothetical protein